MMPGTSANFWKSIWKLNLNDRLRLFIWKIAWNLFPTMERLNAIFSSPDIDVVCMSSLQRWRRFYPAFIF
jgi:hypothetical protein